MASAAGTGETVERIERRTYNAREVATISGLAAPTIYQRAKASPTDWGLIKCGRAVRFSRDVIDRRWPPPQK